MELDDFKTILPSQSTDTESGKNLKQTDNMDNIIEKLKAIDAKDKKTLTVMSFVFVMMVVIYTGISQRQTGITQSGYGILILGFLLTIVYLLFNLFKIRKVDYAEPARIFLKKALRRHAFLKPVDWLISLPILALFFSGGFLIVKHSFLKYMSSTTIPETIYFLVFTLSVGIGFWAGYQQWQKNKAPVVNDIKAALKEFEKD